MIGRYSNQPFTGVVEPGGPWCSRQTLRSLACPRDDFPQRRPPKGSALSTERLTLFTADPMSHSAAHPKGSSRRRGRAESLPGLASGKGMEVSSKCPKGEAAGMTHPASRSSHGRTSDEVNHDRLRTTDGHRPHSSLSWSSVRAVEKVGRQLRPAVEPPRSQRITDAPTKALIPPRSHTSSDRTARSPSIRLTPR